VLVRRESPGRLPDPQEDYAFVGRVQIGIPAQLEHRLQEAEGDRFEHGPALARREVLDRPFLYWRGCASMRG